MFKGVYKCLFLLLVIFLFSYTCFAQVKKTTTAHPKPAQHAKPVTAHTRDSLAALKCFMLGTELRQKGKYKPAEQQFLRAVTLSPRFVRAYLLLGNLYQYNLNMPDKAQKYYLKTVSIDSNNDVAYALLGHYYYELYHKKNTPNYLSMARQFFKRSVALQPGVNCSLYNMIGLTFLNEKNYDSAAAYFQNGMQMWPQDPASFENMAILSSLQGKNEEAQKYFDSASRLKGSK